MNDDANTPGSAPNGKWIYAYDYAPDEVWEPWRTEPAPARWIDGEARAAAGRVNRLSAPGSLRFALLSDTHYTVNGTWDDTFESIRQMHSLAGYDGVIHLGDLTDGMVSAAATRGYERIITDGLRSLGLPLHLVCGNHDYNYFRGNTELIYPEPARHYTDYPEQRLRLVFIDSFDPKESVRYGFSRDCLDWLDCTLRDTPDGYCVVVFSHVTPLVRLQAWTGSIRGNAELIGILDAHCGKILAFVNGHNHCDHIFNDLYNDAFPIISVNCAKCEYYTEHKPEGAVVPPRKLGDRSQESWDTLIVNTAARRLDFIRFGAGRDRVVANGKAAYV
jgi:hypothetical protein